MNNLMKFFKKIAEKQISESHKDELSYSDIIKIMKAEKEIKEPSKFEIAVAEILKS